MGRQAHERSGQHPREVRRPASQELTQDLRLGTEGADENTGLDSMRIDNADETPVIDDTVPDDKEQEEGTEGELVDDPDKAKRKRLKAKSVSTGTQAGQGTDWTQYDLSKAMRLLHSLDEPTVRRELRKLHLRMHHC